MNKNINQGNIVKKFSGIEGCEITKSAKETLGRLPVFKSIENKVISLNDTLWDYAIEITTDDCITYACWEDYTHVIDEVCNGFFDNKFYVEENILPIFVFDEVDFMLKILVLIGHRNSRRDTESISSQRCLNLKLHRSFCSENTGYFYKHYVNEDPTYMSVDDVNELVELYRYEGNIHYLPSRMQLPFCNVIDLASSRLQVCSVQ